MSTISNDYDMNDDERVIIENYRKLSENEKKLFLNNLSLSKNVNDMDTLNCSNISGKDNLQILPTLKHTNNNSDDKLVDTNDSSQLNQTECKYLLNMLSKNDLEQADLNTQDEKVLTKLTKKNVKCFLNSNMDGIEINNTQQFIDLNLCKVAQQLQTSEISQINDTKIQTAEIMDIDDSVTTPSISANESKQNNKSFNTQKSSEKCYSQCSSMDLKLSYQDSKLSDKDQDPEIITFQTMCDKLMNIDEADDDDDVNSSVIVRVNNQVNRIDFKQIDADVLACINYEECVPSTSKLNSTTCVNFLDITDRASEHTANKRKKFSDLILNLSDDSSTENPTDLLQKRLDDHKKSKLTRSKNSKVRSDKIVTKFNTLNKLDIINNSTSENEDKSKSNKRKLPKVTYKKTNGHHKNVQSDRLSEQKKLTETTAIFHISPNGFIHQDMLEYINSKNNV